MLSRCKEIGCSEEAAPYERPVTFCNMVQKLEPISLVLTDESKLRAREGCSKTPGQSTGTEQALSPDFHRSSDVVVFSDNIGNCATKQKTSIDKDILDTVVEDEGPFASPTPEYMTTRGNLYRGAKRVVRKDREILPGTDMAI
jgi:hypothetical protein